MIFGMILLMLLALGFAAALAWRRRFEQTLPLVCGLIILVLYVFGLMGALRYGVFFIAAAAVACAGYTAYMLWRHPDVRAQLFSSLLTPGLLVFVLFAALLYWMNIGRLLSEWDEFTHWGLVVKNMVNLDAFGNTPGATTYFLDYPPGSALFLYFFQAFYPTFNESYLMIAQGILSVSFLLPVFAKVSWQRWKALLLLAPLTLCLPLAFYPTFLSTIYVDALLGLEFAYLLFTYFSQPKLSGLLLLELSVGCAVLSLTKSSGLGLSGIALLLIVLDLAIHRRAALKAFVQRAPGGGLRWARVAGLASPAIAMLAANASWKARLSALQIGPHFDTGEISLSGLSELFAGTAPDYRVNTVDAFVRRVLGITDTGVALHTGYTMAFWVLLFLSAIVVFYFLCQNKGHFRRLRTLCIGLTVSFVLYAAYLLLLYLFTYSQSEAQNLASCDRYLYTFLLGGSTLLLFLFVHFGQLRLSARPFYALCAGCLALCLAIAPNTIRLPLSVDEQKQNTVAQRGRYLQAEEAAAVLDAGTASVYVVSQNDPTLGLDYFTLRYVMTPVQVQQRGEGQSWQDVSFSLGTPYYDGDTLTRDITAEDWGQELLSQYTHVYLMHPDEQFVSLYGVLFESPEDIADNTLFAVQQTPSGQVQLVHVPY